MIPGLRFISSLAHSHGYKVNGTVIITLHRPGSSPARWSAIAQGRHRQSKEVTGLNPLWPSEAPLKAPSLNRPTAHCSDRLSVVHSTISLLALFPSFPSHFLHLRRLPSSATPRTPAEHLNHRDPSQSLALSRRPSLLAAQVNGRRRSLGKDGYCAWEHSPQYPDFPGPNGSQIPEYRRHSERAGVRSEYLFTFPGVFRYSRRAASSTSYAAPRTVSRETQPDRITVSQF
ncbi:hypothetical protein J3F83DRAFT_184416 [Trichoderma novae-zelandiae]